MIRSCALVALARVPRQRATHAPALHAGLAASLELSNAKHARLAREAARKASPCPKASSPYRRRMKITSTNANSQ